MKRQRILAIAVVLLAATFALAAPGRTPGLYVEPAVIELFPTGMGSGGSGGVQFHNDSTTALTVAAIDRDASCATTDGTGISVLASLPFTVPALGTGSAGITCPTTGPSGMGFGIRRCRFHADDGVAPLASFTGLCVYRGAPQLTTTTPALNFGTVSVGGEAVRPVSITTPIGVSGVYFSITDQDGNFAVSTPCADAAHCLAAIAVLPGGTFSAQVKCTPTRAGAASALLHVIGADGQHLATPIALGCTGAAATTGTIIVSSDHITLAHPVNQGSASGSITVSNMGTADLVISSITKSGSPDWTMGVGAGCAATGCTLPPTGSFTIDGVFQPTAITTAADATITISSNDPMAGTQLITLDGTGLGSTLVLETPLGSPPSVDLGSAPAGTSTSTIVTLGNDPATEPLPVTVTASPATVFTVDQDVFTIAASGTHPLGITCTPDAPPRTIAGTVTITGMATFGSPIEIGVSCTSTAGNLFAVPSAVALGEVRVDTARTTPIELRTSGAMLDITSNPSLVNTIPGMTVGAPSSPAITSAAPSTFELRVTPATDGDLANTIEVAAGADMIAIPVTGRAVTPSIEVPTDVHLGTFCIDQPTRASSVELLADGTATIMMPAKPVLAGAPSPFAIAYTQPVEGGYPYALGAAQRATVELRPQQQSAPGPREDVLVWQTDMPGATAPRTRLRVEFADVGGAISPRTAAFGSVPRGQSSMTKSITLQNCGTEPMTLSPPVVIPEGEFRDVSATALPAMLAPNQIATLTIVFVPARTGPRTARLSIASSTGPLEVELSGLGLGDADVTPDKTSFYACGCRTQDPTGVLAIGLVLVLALVPRRRRR